jgi:hypothetical protein
MPRYDIFAVCNACGEAHSTGIAIMLQTGPRQNQSVADAFAGKEPPPEVAAVKNNRVYCPKTGRGYAQTNYKQIFLVPVGSVPH